MRIGFVDGLSSKKGDPKDKYDKFKGLATGTLYNSLVKNGHRVFVYSSLSKPEKDVDLFHIHNIGYASIYLAFLKRKPLIFTSHNGLITCNYKSLKVIFSKMLTSIVLNRADLAIALCEQENKVFQEEFGISPDKIKIIHNGINTSIYAEPRTNTNLNDKKIKLLCVAHLEKYKGIEYLLRALNQAKCECHNEIELIIVSFSQSRIKELQKLCMHLSLTDNVRFLSSLSTNDLIDLYYWCDIYLHPSLAEDLPTAIIEAMVCGKPVIATDVGGIPEQVTSETGILVKPRDIIGLAKAIKTLSSDPRLRETMGQQGKERVLSDFNEDVMYKKHLEVYRDVLKRNVKNQSNDVIYILYKTAFNILYHVLKMKSLIK
jgi:glycosyltransferase involved in cell wall biosynthesis